MTASTDELVPQVKHTSPVTDAETTAFPVTLAGLQQTYATVLLVGPEEPGLLNTLVLLLMLAATFAVTASDSPLLPVTPEHVTVMLPLVRPPAAGKWMSSPQARCTQCLWLQIWLGLGFLPRLDVVPNVTNHYALD